MYTLRYGCWFVGCDDLAVALHDLYLQFPPPLFLASIKLVNPDLPGKMAVKTERDALLPACSFVACCNNTVLCTTSWHHNTEDERLWCLFSWPMFQRITPVMVRCPKGFQRRNTGDFCGWIIYRQFTQFQVIMVTDPQQTNTQANLQTGPITIHCTAAS